MIDRYKGSKKNLYTRIFTKYSTRYSLGETKKSKMNLQNGIVKNFSLLLGFLLFSLVLVPAPTLASSSLPVKEKEEVTNLDKQIAKDIAEENPSLITLLRQYYYYRHKYNERAGVNALVWLADAALWQPTKTV
ncbi:hypothetical protein MUP32_06255 [Candidatus Microgenomates bacterium]|nr:hypothetical protein [Candidatus Microgenomates bacterium]